MKMSGKRDSEQDTLDDMCTEPPVKQDWISSHHNVGQTPYGCR